MRLHSFSALAAALTLATTSGAQDWKGLARLEGKVTDTEGRPMPDVVIKLDLPGRGGTQVKTDKKGKWAILGLASGAWNLDFEAPGFVPKQLAVTIQQETRVAPIQVKLEKAAPSGPPPEVVAAIEKGDSAYKAEKWAEARAEYQKLLELMADRPEVARHLHMQIARCYSQEQNYPKELEHLQMLLDADPANAGVRKLMALEALKGGLFDRGNELLAGLPDSELQDPDVLYNVAVAFFNQQRLDDTVTYLTKAVTIQPGYADGYFLRGNAYLGLGRIAEAKADYAKFLELAPDDARAETLKKALAQLQ